MLAFRPAGCYAPPTFSPFKSMVRLYGTWPACPAIQASGLLWGSPPREDLTDSLLLSGLLCGPLPNKPLRRLSFLILDSSPGTCSPPEELGREGGSEAWREAGREPEREYGRDGDSLRGRESSAIEGGGGRSSKAAEADTTGWMVGRECTTLGGGGDGGG